MGARGAKRASGKGSATCPRSASPRSRPEAVSSALRRWVPDARSSRARAREKGEKWRLHSVPAEEVEAGGGSALPACRTASASRRLPPQAAFPCSAQLSPALARAPERRHRLVSPARLGSVGPECPAGGLPCSALRRGVGLVRGPDHGEHPEELPAASRIQVSRARAWAWGRGRAWGGRRQQPFHLLSDPLFQDPRCQLPGRQGWGRQWRRGRRGRGPGKSAEPASGGCKRRPGRPGFVCPGWGQEAPSGRCSGGWRLGLRVQRRVAPAKGPRLKPFCFAGPVLLCKEQHLSPGNGLWGSLLGTLERSVFRVLVLTERGILGEARVKGWNPCVVRFGKEK